MKTSVDTAGDLTQIQVKIQLSGTQFGVKPPGIPMPKTIRLINDGYKCLAPTRSSKYLIALVSFMPLISVTNLNLLYIFLQRPRCMYVVLGTQNLTMGINHIAQLTMDERGIYEHSERSLHS